MAIIASGDISIDAMVNSEDGVAGIEGIYIADGSFSTGSGNQKLIIEGTVVGWQGVSLGRDFGSTRNNTEPVEEFLYRPDLVTSAPSYLKRPNLVWEEVAP